MGSHGTRRHGRQYLAYVCRTYVTKGARACPGSRATMHEVDDFVVARLRALGQDEDLIAETAKAAQEARKERLGALRREQQTARADIKRLEAEQKTLADQSGAEVARRRVVLGLRARWVHVADNGSCCVTTSQ